MIQLPKLNIFELIVAAPRDGQFDDTRELPKIKGDPRFYNYHGRSTLALGRNFDPRDITEPKPACIIFTPEPLDAGSPSAEIHATFVRNWRQINFTLGLESHFEARYLTGGGSSDYTFTNETDFTESSISVIIRASAQYGRHGIKAGAELTPEAIALRTDGTKFAKRFGTRYVAFERRGAHLAVLLTVQSLDQSTKSTFVSEFKADGGWGELTASASAKFNAILKIAAKQSRIQISATSTGGEGLSQLGKLLQGSTNSADPMAEMMNHVAQTLAGFSKDNATPIEYTVSTMEDFLWDPSGVPPWPDAQEEGIQRLADDYRSTVRDLEIIGNYENRRGDYWELFPDFFSYSPISETRKSVENYQVAVRDQHKACLSGFSSEACSLPEGRYPNKSPWRKFFHEILQERARRPTATIEVHAVMDDGKLSVLDPVKSASVFRFAPGNRLSVVKQYEPEASWFYASISISGVGLIGYKQVTEYSNGVRQISDVVVGGDFVLPLAEEGRGANDTGFEANTLSWMAEHLGTWSATTSFVLIDRTNKQFTVRLSEAEWQANGTSITQGDLRILAANGVLERHFSQ